MEGRTRREGWDSELSGGGKGDGLLGPVGRRSNGLGSNAVDCRGGESSSAAGDVGRGVVERTDISPDVRDTGRTGLGGSSADKLELSFRGDNVSSHLRK